MLRKSRFFKKAQNSAGNPAEILQKWPVFLYIAKNPARHASKNK